MISAPQVSVIIPTYNRSALLLESLGSILNQRYRPIEVVVVDDGSSDDTASVVADWQRNLPRDSGFTLKYIHQENAGASAARNAGLDVATGKYIHFVDSDDLVMKDIYQLALPHMASHAIDVLHFGLMFRDNRVGEKIGHYAADSSEPLLQQFFRGRLKGYGFGFIRTREVIERAGLWDTDLEISEDRVFCFRTLLAADKTGTLPNALYEVRIHEGSRLSEDKTTAQWWENRLRSEGKIANLVGELSELSDYRSQFRTNLYNVGIRLYDSGLIQLGSAFGELARSLGKDESRPGETRLRIIWSLGPAASKVWSWGRRIKARSLPEAGVS